jgi:hypothetical protein
MFSGAKGLRKVFFFEKKKQKTFVYCEINWLFWPEAARWIKHGRAVQPSNNQKFLLLFPKRSAFFLTG